MKTEKKLIALSALAILIGIASIMPAMFLMSGTAKAETNSVKPWFNVDIPYAWWETSNPEVNATYFMHEFPFNSTAWEFYDFNGTDMQRNSSLPPVVTNVTSKILFFVEKHAIILNVTPTSDAYADMADARIEYFDVELSSEKGLITSMSWFFGTNGTEDFELPEFSFARNDWGFNRTTADKGMFTLDWALSPALGQIRGGGSGTEGSSTEDIFTLIRKAENLSITIRRIGYVTFQGNSTEVTLADNEIVAQVQLEKYRNGYLYNNIFTDEQLSQITLYNPYPPIPQSVP